MLRLFNNAPALFANGKPVAIFAATAAGWSKAVKIARDVKAAL